MKKTIKTIAMLCLVMGSTEVIAQNTAINSTGAAPDASAMLDVSSTTKGLLMPRMTLAQKTAIASPATGLTVYQTDGTTGYYYYDGASWTRLATVATPTFLSKSADYTITSSDAANGLIIINTANAVKEFTLPLANSVTAGTTIYISGTSVAPTQSTNVICSGADKLRGTYMGAAGGSNINTVLGAYISAVSLISDGSANWYVVTLWY